MMKLRGDWRPLPVGSTCQSKLLRRENDKIPLLVDEASTEDLEIKLASRCLFSFNSKRLLLFVQYFISIDCNIYLYKLQFYLY
jgi:hypothetical protein